MREEHDSQGSISGQSATRFVWWRTRSGCETKAERVGYRAPVCHGRCARDCAGHDAPGGRSEAEAGQRTPFVVAHVLGQQDWLRELARLDLGCMWVTGSIAPDHAHRGRFIVMHEDSLTQGFVESLTRAILKASGSSSTRLAGDGPVIEAACSHDKLLKEEAVKARAHAARPCASAPANRRPWGNASTVDEGSRHRTSRRFWLTGVQAEAVLLDAGDFDDAVIEATLARDVSLLCCEGQWPAKTREDGLFPQKRVRR